MIQTLYPAQPDQLNPKIMEQWKYGGITVYKTTEVATNAFGNEENKGYLKKSKTKKTRVDLLDSRKKNKSNI